jgi:hypothetical protein
MAEVTKHSNDPGPERPGENPQVSHERKDVNVFQITAFGIALLFGCIVVIFAMWAMFDFLYSRENAKNPTNRPSMVTERQKLPPQPRLQAIPKIELGKLRHNEEQILTSFGWLDQGKGTVRIPIDLAIDIVAKKGLPSRPSPAGQANDGYRTIPEVSSSGRTLERIAQ